jgi:hypothetical protein
VLFFQQYYQPHVKIGRKSRRLEKQASWGGLINFDFVIKGWTGKNWACQSGANKATGELLLFFVSDVGLVIDAHIADLPFIIGKGPTVQGSKNC